MDPALISSLATGAVAALAPYLAKAGEEFAKGVGKEASNRIGALYETIAKRFRDRPAAAEALDDLQAMPDDADTQAALRAQLKKQMAADNAFADELGRLMDEIGQDKESVTFLTQVYGGKVGKIINIEQAHIVDID